MSHPELGDLTRLADWQGETSGPWNRLNGAWETTPHGIQVLAPTKLLFFFAEQPQSDWAIRFTDVAGDGVLYVEVDEYAFDIGGASAPASRIYQSWGQTVVLAATGHCPRLAPGPHEVICRRGQGRVELWIDSTRLLRADDPAPDQASVSLTAFLSKGVGLTGIHVEGQVQAAVEQRPVRVPRRATFELDVCIDFFDDLVHSAWDQDTLDAAMNFHRAHGVRRIHYIHTGGYKGGWYDRRGQEGQRPGFQARIDRTHQQIGEFLPAIAAAARRHGMETVAVFKPFEGGMGYTVANPAQSPGVTGKIPSLGGMLWWCTDFVAAHPHLRMERNMQDVPDDLDSRRIGKIVLTAEKGLPQRLDPQSIKLWVSGDNGRYVPLESGFTRREEEGECRKIIFDDLRLDERFVAITCEHPARSFGNLLAELIRVYDTEGQALPCTLAFSKGRSGASDFRASGFDMDSAGASCLENFHWLDQPGPIAFGVGKNRYISGALCAAYPEVQDHWMAEVEFCIAAGVNAVDFRLHHHNRALDWGAYGFNEPVVRAFQERYGIDIRTQRFDREALRGLQGEFYTAFLRRARGRLRAAGVAMHAHLEMRMYPPRWPTYMEIRFPWRQWVDEGLVDEITLKSFRTLRSGVSLKAIDFLRRETGVRINACPYLNDLVGQPNGRELLDFCIQDARAVGVDGFTLYENAAIMAAKPEGDIEITHPWVMEALVN